MGDTLNDRLRALREDYARTVGEPFEHFYCPLRTRCPKSVHTRCETRGIDTNRYENKYASKPM